MTGACAVVGAQFGSEGKGNVVAHIAKDYAHHVRVGAANAGHTIYVPEKFGSAEVSGEFEKHVMQQIPCAAYANPGARVYIGPGALISPEIFGGELRFLADWRKERGLPPIVVEVDYRAQVIHEAQIEEEVASGLGDRIGSTSARAREGIGVAQADRVMRSKRCLTAQESFCDTSFPEWDLVHITDVPMLLDYRARDTGILLEGTQGTDLSLTTGMFPYVTSRNTTSAGLCADAGVAPTKLDRVILVARTYPIRVAGESGPFASGSREIRWGQIGIDPENERTTVTKLLRRVATFSLEQIQKACVLNGATEIALMFCDYLEPSIAGECGQQFNLPLGRYSKVQELITLIEAATDTPVTILGTGPHSILTRESCHPR